MATLRRLVWFREETNWRHHNNPATTSLTCPTSPDPNYPKTGNKQMPKWTIYFIIIKMSATGWLNKNNLKRLKTPQPLQISSKKTTSRSIRLTIWSSSRAKTDSGMMVVRSLTVQVQQFRSEWATKTPMKSSFPSWISTTNIQNHWQLDPTCRMTKADRASNSLLLTVCMQATRYSSTSWRWHARLRLPLGLLALTPFNTPLVLVLIYQWACSHYSWTTSKLVSFYKLKLIQVGWWQSWALTIWLARTSKSKINWFVKDSPKTSTSKIEMVKSAEQSPHSKCSLQTTLQRFQEWTRIK